MSPKIFKTKIKQSTTKGFTLIELLVVVAIIGILSSVVLASLNSAREKSKIALIKSTLKQLYSQAELTYNDTGSYVSLYNTSTFDCIGSLSKMAESLTNQGVTVKCYSVNIPANNDIYLRFGVTAIIYSSTELKAWSIDQNGIVKWDTQGVDISGNFIPSDSYLTWGEANTACVSSKGRLPSVEQLKTLYNAFYSASGSMSIPYTPLTFINNHSYRTSSLNPKDNSLKYYVWMDDGSVGTSGGVGGGYFRCVR